MVAESTGELVDRLSVDGRVLERVRRPALAVTMGLEPHPEGGWYRRTWTSPERLTLTAPDGSTRERPAATLIVFLLPSGESSAWHRVSSAETWIWNGPGRVALQFGGSGEEPVDGETVLLGSAVDGLVVQALVPADVWQRTLPSTEDALVSCVVSPGFDFADFSMPEE
ncbi:cupin [Rathayibacter caricis DSM 15933]|uniref:Cupin n=1 Tax=Rathayibacter caricis DSM 15933 TaxID=1328867 RepID=A0A2T4URW1_9MICO|nr:cupin domain-containing protein [Rathayibacter caricis]PTL72241.1 cupin [Rathayibacter caricis DSM 15933]